MVKRTNGCSDELVCPPGETIREMLEDKGMTQEELSIRLGMSTKHVSQIITGKKPITYNSALRLESVFNVPASFWNNLERIYREKIVRQEQAQKFENEIAILRQIPLKQLTEYGYIEPATATVDKIALLRSFLGVSDLNYVGKLMERVAFRKSDRATLSVYALAAWIRMCEIDTDTIDVEKFKREKLQKLIPTIRSKIGQNPQEFVPALTAILASCGVAFSIVRRLPRAPVQGMTKHTKDRVILGMTLRGKSADIFWFSLFHELGHILLHDKKDIFLDLEAETHDCQKEIEANQFAAETIIPSEQYQDFLKSSCFDLNSVSEFAHRISIHPCMVVGKLQREGFARYDDAMLNSVKIRYELAH